MRQNEMKQRWATGESGVGLWLTVPDSSIAENLGTLDPAYLVVDMQHGLIDYSDVRHIFQAIQRSAATPLIRVPWLLGQIAINGISEYSRLTMLQLSGQHAVDCQTELKIFQ